MVSGCNYLHPNLKVTKVAQILSYTDFFLVPITVYLKALLYSFISLRFNRKKTLKKCQNEKSRPFFANNFLSNHNGKWLKNQLYCKSSWQRVKKDISNMRFILLDCKGITIDFLHCGKKIGGLQIFHRTLDGFAFQTVTNRKVLAGAKQKYWKDGINIKLVS
jgi:hypothetical protein